MRKPFYVLSILWIYICNLQVNIQNLHILAVLLFYKHFFFQVKKVSHADGSKRRKALKHNFGYNTGFIRLIFVEIKGNKVALLYYLHN